MSPLRKVFKNGDGGVGFFLLCTITYMACTNVSCYINLCARLCCWMFHCVCEIMVTVKLLLLSYLLPVEYQSGVQSCAWVCVNVCVCVHAFSYSFSDCSGHSLWCAAVAPCGSDNSLFASSTQHQPLSTVALVFSLLLIFLFILGTSYHYSFSGYLQT